MEYYIMLLYQTKRQELFESDKKIKQLHDKLAKKIIACLIALVLMAIATLVTMVLWKKIIWQIIGIIICFIILFTMLFLVEKAKKEERLYVDIYIDSYLKRLEVLDNILNDKIKIDHKEKIEKFIEMYQEYIDKRNNEQRKAINVVLALFSALSVILTISLENMGIIGIVFQDWMYLATILLVAVVGASCYILFYVWSNNLSKEYDLIIKDMKMLVISKYMD